MTYPVSRIGVLIVGMVMAKGNIILLAVLVDLFSRYTKQRANKLHIVPASAAPIRLASVSVWQEDF